jgi:hypothetical protein
VSLDTAVHPTVSIFSANSKPDSKRLVYQGPEWELFVEKNRGPKTTVPRTIVPRMDQTGTKPRMKIAKNDHPWNGPCQERPSLHGTDHAKNDHPRPFLQQPYLKLNVTNLPTVQTIKSGIHNSENSYKIINSVT